jgi:hypothetical protein
MWLRDIVWHGVGAADSCAALGFGWVADRLLLLPTTPGKLSRQLVLVGKAVGLSPSEVKAVVHTTATSCCMFLISIVLAFMVGVVALLVGVLPPVTTTTTPTYVPGTYYGTVRPKDFC